MQDVTRKVQQLPAPVIAAVHGFALGAGCEFALCCDLVAAHSSAVFGFPEVEVGLSVTGGISHLLPLAVGAAKAKELVLLGGRIDATGGVATGVGERGQRRRAGAGRRVGGRARAPARLAVSLAKAALDRGPHGGIDAAYELEIVDSLALRETPEAAAAAAAFRQRGAGRETSA